jgi:hypothetical protein
VEEAVKHLGASDCGLFLRACLFSLRAPLSTLCRSRDQIRYHACRVLSACRPSGRLALRHRLARVLPGASHVNRVRMQPRNLTAQQTGGLEPNPLHTNLVTQLTVWECMLSGMHASGTGVWPGRPHREHWRVFVGVGSTHFRYDIDHRITYK